MSFHTLMIQGTGSSVGKSVIVTALCRICALKGYRVAPFKAQNMALNSYVTPDGYEIGRAQAVQAFAAMREPEVDMNPVLIKPEGDAMSQVVVMGKPWKRVRAGEYYCHRKELWGCVIASLKRLKERYELLIIEGAGSPAEINLSGGDIVNMAVAHQLDAPVVLVGDIDRGGVFASLYGTLFLLPEQSQRLIKGFLINKFRGVKRLLEPGLDLFTELTGGRPVLGILPYIRDIGLAQEDSVFLDEQYNRAGSGEATIAVVRFPHISNYDDMDAFAMEKGVQVIFTDSCKQILAADAVILPGTKTTLSDLIWLRSRGIEGALYAMVSCGKPVVGICGGYQMLGKTIRDIYGIEGEKGEQPGLGLLPVITTFGEKKRIQRLTAYITGGSGFLSALKDSKVSGYHIHMGSSTLLEGGESLLSYDNGKYTDGAVALEGKVWGTALHGIFDEPGLRQAWLRSLGWNGAGTGESLSVLRERAYEQLAEVFLNNTDMDKLLHIAGLV
jgi:adenosylcobyric acid synthase